MPAHGSDQRSAVKAIVLNAYGGPDVLELKEVGKPERCDRLKEISHKMHAGYRELGFNVGDSETPIVPVIIGDLMLTFQMWKTLLQAGVYTNAVVPPAVAPGTARLRTSYMATHTDEQLDRVLEVFGDVGKELGVI